MKKYPMRINLNGEWVEMEADAGETLLLALRTQNFPLFVSKEIRKLQNLFMMGFHHSWLKT